LYKKLIKNKNFMLLTTGGFISTIGDYLYNIGLLISLYSVTKSVGAVTLMWLSRAVLRIPVQYIAGIITDNYNKKKIIVLTNLISVIIAFSFIFLTPKTLWIAYILAFLLQSLNDIDVSSETALLPELVPKEELSYANSVFSVLESVSIFLSPALAGIIYKVYDSNILFKINALSFLIAGILFTFIKYSCEKSMGTTLKFELIKSGKEGYNILSKYTDVKNLFILVSVYALLGRFYETYKVIVADVLLRINADGIIYFDYALAFGGLLVPLIIKALSKYKQLNVFIITSLIISLGYIVFGYSNSFVITFISLIVLGTTFSIQGIYSKTIIQKNIPQEYIGRVFSFYKILLTAFAIIGLVIANPLYNTVGIGNAFLIIVLISIVLCIKQLIYKDKKLTITQDKSA